MREAAGEQQQEPAAGEAGSSVCAEPAGTGHCGQPWKKFVYVEPPKRVKEVLEEELYFRRDGCQIKHPAAGCFFPAQWAIADLAKLPMNARAVSRSGSGRNMECEKKFLRGRLDTSITEQKQFTFTAQVLFQARRNKKIAPMKSNISLSGGHGSGQAPPCVTKPMIILFQQTQKYHNIDRVLYFV